MITRPPPNTPPTAVSGVKAMAEIGHSRMDGAGLNSAVSGLLSEKSPKHPLASEMAPMAAR